MRLKVSGPKKIKPFLVSLLVMGSFLIAPRVFAWDADVLGGIIGWIIGVFVSALGLILILVIKGLLIIASYQEFITSRAVIEGWVVVRDFANMFFVVILLVIAFATILHIENYNYKKWLPKLILMAVLINFSKTICGLLIDVAQIVMLTFVNAFKDIAGGNFIELLGIRDIVTLAKESEPGEMGFWTIVGAYVLGLIYMIVALVVITTMMMMLAMRMVMIWIYVVLSPLAYLLAAFPGGAQYASKWWKDFISNLIVGPVLAFFIWLSFAALQTGSIDQSIADAENASVASETAEMGYEAGEATDSEKAVINTLASTPGALIKFIVGIGMLIGGLKIAQEVGGAAGSIAGKGMKQLSSMGAATTKFGKNWAGRIATGDNLAARKFTKAVGFDLRPGSIVSAVKSSYEKTKKDDEDTIKTKGASNLDKGGFRAVFGGAGAGQSWANNYTHGFLGLKGVANAVKEVVVRPSQRKSISKDLDKEQEELDVLQQSRDQYVSSSDHQKATQEIKSADSEIQTLERKISSGEITLNSDEYSKARSSIKKLEKKKQTAQENIAGKTIDDNKYEELSGKINNKEAIISKKRQDLARVAPPQALEGRSHYRQIINERKNQYKDVTNADELVNLFEDAVRRKDRFDQTAILEKLTNDANLNEMMRAKGYASNSKGMYDFLRNNKNEKGERRGLDVKGLKLDESQILQIQNDLSEAAERVNHWEFAKTVGVNGKGRMESLVHYDENGKWNDDKHVVAAATEVAKMDPQKQTINLGRLAYGGEDANGKYHLSNLGRVLVKMLDQSGTYKDQEKRINQSIAVHLTLPDSMKELEKLNISASSIEALSSVGGAKTGGNNDPTVLLESIKQAINDLNNAISS